MESTSEPMKIHCSKDIATLLQASQDSLILQRRGVIPVKGKGEMETFWLKANHSEAAIFIDSVTQSAVTTCAQQ
jgi:hypothetical protein